MQPATFDIDAYRSSMAEVIGQGPETQVFWDALDFACEAHKTQRRRSGEPYIMHPCSVARILAIELDIRSPAMLAAALLHDTIEDVETVDGALIREKFGPDVEAIVEGCTKVTHFSGDRQTLRKQVHRKIFSGAAAKPEVMLVKLADRLHNLRTLGSMDRARRTKIAEETLDIYAPLATILGLYDIKREMYTLALGYRFPRQSKPIAARIRALQSDPGALSVVARVREGLAERGLAAEVMLRTRDLWAYYDAKNHILVERIEHPQTIIIQAASRDDCYAALGLLNSIYPPTPRSIRDFIANPKPTGYQGLHARPNINGQEYLFKIRTEEMSLMARRGLIRDWERGGKSGSRFFERIQEMFDIMGSDESMSYRELIVAGNRKEIYTYTPKGDLVCLPANSIVLDFAFRIHSAVGHSCAGAMIGQREAAPTDRLRDGDMVRILRGEENVVFDPETQALCQTPQARSELSRAFRARREEVSRAIGDSILHQELRRYGIPREILDGDGMNDVLAAFGFAAMPELHLSLGEGRLRLDELVATIRDRLWAGHPTLLPPTGELNQVVLNTVDPVVMKMSACCRPSPLDKGVIGLLSERGLSLHRHDCPQLSRVHFRREEAVEARWKLAETRIAKPQKLVVMRTARARLFEVLAAAPKEMRLAELIRLDRDDVAEGDWELSFRVNTLRGLKKSVHHFERAGLPFEFELEA